MPEDRRVIAPSSPYESPQRILRALAFADLLDAAGIASLSVEAMDANEWGILAAAAGVRAPSAGTRELTIALLRRSEDVRRRLRPVVESRNRPHKQAA